MPHALELEYGLTAQELLDAIDRRFRLKVALEGAVAEVHFERKLRIASREGWLTSYEDHDVDGMHAAMLWCVKNRERLPHMGQISNELVQPLSAAQGAQTFVKHVDDCLSR